MPISTQTQTVTTTQVGDLRQVLNCIDREILTICGSYTTAAVKFDRDDVIQDISLLALREIISSAHLQYYLNGELVREHSYHIAENPLEPWGPPPDQPPIGTIPPGCSVRIVVHRNPNTPRDVCDAWFKRLGWSTAETLVMPDGQPVPYGTFVSGGYGVERRLLTNPRFEGASSSTAMRKDY